MAAAASERRKALEWSAFWKLDRLAKRFPTIHLCKSEVILHYLYDYDNFSLWLWILRLSLDMESKINAFVTSCYRIMLGIKQQDCISSIAIYSITNTGPLVYYVRKRQLGFVGHILHLPEEEPARRCAFICTTSWQKDWSQVIHKPLTSRTPNTCYNEVEVSADEIATLANDHMHGEIL